MSQNRTDAPEAHWGPQGPPTPPEQPSPTAASQAARGLVIGLRSGKEKINSLCHTNCCPFPQALTILSLFPVEQIIGKPTAVVFALWWRLKDNPPRAQGEGRQAAPSVATGEGGSPGKGTPQSQAWSKLHLAPSMGWGRFPVQLKDGGPPGTALRLALRTG